MSYLDIVFYVCQFIAVLMVISLHEFSHAFVAVKCGDDTPKIKGRLTLNPFAHTNLIGLVMMFLVGFGWAEPVPINPYNFKNIKKGYFWTSIAGVLSNYAFAFIAYPLYILSINFLPNNSFACIFISNLLMCIFRLNLCFFVFNLIPIYPLDGFRVLEVIVKTRGKIMTFLREKAQIILIVLFVMSFIAERVTALWFLDVFGFLMDFAIGIIGWPITAFWNLIF